MRLATMRDAVRRFNEAQGFLLAAALAFSFLVCLAPLALVLFSAIGFLLASDQATEAVIRIATSLLPGYLEEILGVLDLLNRERRVAGVLGAIGLAIFATPLFTLTRTAMNATFRVRRGRGLVHGFAFDLLALGVVGLLATALAAALAMLAALANIAAETGLPDWIVESPWVAAAARTLLYGALLGLLFFIYRAFPNTAVSTRAAVTTTLVVAALWEVARRAFAAYLVAFGAYGKLYGSFGVAAATFAWIYYSAAIFVFGAGLTAVLTERHLGAAPRPAEIIAPDRESARPPRSRLPGYALSAALGAALIVLASQNRAPVTLVLFDWVIEVPLAAVVLGALTVGAVAAGLPLLIARSSRRARVHDLERGPSADEHRDST
jgi:membrane protein